MDRMPTDILEEEHRFIQQVVGALPRGTTWTTPELADEVVGVELYRGALSQGKLPRLYKGLASSHSLALPVALARPPQAAHRNRFERFTFQATGFAGGL